MMNMNWREAIKQAQQKIDKVLDIRSEEQEADVETSSSQVEDAPDSDENLGTPASISPRSDEEQLVVTLEPVLPPSSHGVFVGDDIQTIVSSDIELLPEPITPNVSPEMMDNVEIPDLHEMVRNNRHLKRKLETEQKKSLELKEQNAKLCSKSAAIEKDFESFKSEASKFSQEAFKARQDAKISRAKIAELTKELEGMTEKLTTKETKIKGMKSAMDDNLAIVQKYTTSNSSQADNIKKLKDELNGKTNRISELEAMVEQFEYKQHDEETGTMYMDDMVEHTVNGLKQEVDEYKKVNHSLKEELKQLRETIEQKQYEYEDKMSEAVNAARTNFNQESSNLRNEYDALLLEKRDLERREENHHRSLENSKREILALRKDLETVRRLIAEMFAQRENVDLVHDINNAVSTSFEKYRRNVLEEVREKRVKEQSHSLKIDRNTQTDLMVEQPPQVLQDLTDAIRTDQHPQKDACWCSTLQDKKYVANLSEMIKMIDELSVQRDQLETTKRITDLELKDSRRQLSEVLIMHGEKIEELEELRIDNEDLRSMLKEQALNFTSGKE